MIALVAALLALYAEPARAPASPWESRASTIVAADGSGKYKTIQGAIDNSSPDATAENPYIIYVKPGTYRELIYIQREKRHTWLVGDDPEKIIITFNLVAGMPNADGVKMGTFRTPTVVVDADDFHVEGIGIENSAGPRGQALALRVDGDRVTFRNCRFTGWQDTIFLNRGRQYFENCTIIGATDYIFGGATAWFEKCTLHSAGGNFITAASTPRESAYGFVFNNCRITAADEKIRVALGRPWRHYASTIFMNTEMCANVVPVGWNNWGRPDKEKTARYAEFNNTGPGAKTDQRVPWARQLSTDEAAKITVKSVLGGSDNWDPGPTVSRP